VPYDEKVVLAKLARTIELFAPAIVQRCEGAGNKSPVPIFVLGMPRTGSTLVEQILASHKRVLPLGESTAFEHAVNELNAKKERPFPDWLPRLDASDLLFLADRYLSRVLRVARARDNAFTPDSGVRIVDKMPGNFCYAGLIRLALPNARIIHTQRDPIDVCLSCFQRFFEGHSVPYSYDLAELGRFYRHYENLMMAWNATLPQGSILTIDYASLVNDLAREVHRILSYCDLEWDDACLSFHEAGRAVHTASAWQVRQPLFTTSLRKWRPPDETLQPLLDALKG
jgi:hypothetical protein